MWWMVSYVLRHVVNFLIEVLKCGPMPKHVAFIMDGTRRYTKNHNMSLMKGYKMGASKLDQIAELCAKIGIEEVTVYAFSTENFKRDDREVELLMQIGEEYFNKFGNDQENLQRGLRINAIGNIGLLPPKCKQTLSRAVLLTRNNRRLTINFAVAYTSREEITAAVKAVCEGVRKGILEVDDIDEELLGKCMYTSHSRDPDVLIRTSGESRLSDFLLWQISQTFIYFAAVPWPEVSVWHLLRLLFKYQRFCLYERGGNRLEKVVREKWHPRVNKFLEDLDASRWALIERLAVEEV